MTHTTETKSPTRNITIALTSTEAWALLDIVAGYREDSDEVVAEDGPTVQNTVAARIEHILSAKHAALAMEARSR
jgi:hypothetical protein